MSLYNEELPVTGQDKGLAHVLVYMDGHMRRWPLPIYKVVPLPLLRLYTDYSHCSGLESPHHTQFYGSPMCCNTGVLAPLPSTHAHITTMQLVGGLTRSSSIVARHRNQK